MTDSKFDLTFEKRTASPFLRLLGLRKSSNHGAISRVFLTGSWHAIFDRSFPFNFQSIRWFSLVCSVWAELFETFDNFSQKNMAGRQFRIYLSIYIGCCPQLQKETNHLETWCYLPSFRGGLWASWAVEILIRQPIAKLSKKIKLNENMVSMLASLHSVIANSFLRSSDHRSIKSEHHKVCWVGKLSNLDPWESYANVAFKT